MRNYIKQNLKQYSAYTSAMKVLSLRFTACMHATLF